MGAAKPATKGQDKAGLRIVRPDGKSKERIMAEVALDPATGAACNVIMFARGTVGPIDVSETLEVLLDEVKKVRKGDMAGPEAMLVTQAHALDSIFTELARRSAANMGEYIKASECYMRLALKAQAQCRATIETLAALKNPPIIIARQANISNGPQQVNNGTPPPRADETSLAPNELLDTDHGKRLDRGAAETPVTGDPALVAVEASDRA